MLNSSPVVRAAGPRVLFMVGAIVTAAILLWQHHLRLSGELPGVSTIFFVLFAFEDYAATVCELLILAVAVFLASKLPVSSVLRAAGERPRVIAALYTVILAGGAVFVYHAHPLSPAEYAAYFQSQIFAAGHLTGRFPLPQMDWLIPPGFKNFLLPLAPPTGEIAPALWPGHALIMAPFTALGIAWACNPLLSGLTVLIIHRLALLMFANVEAAGLALLLTIASPVMFGLGISYDTMPANLLANCLFALLLARPTPASAWAAGLVGSVALCLTDPVPHLLFALPWLIWIATRGGGVRLLAALCAGYLPLCVVLGIGACEYTGALRSATDALGRVQSLLAAFAAAPNGVLSDRLIGLAKAWVWAVPGMLLLAACGAIRWRRDALGLLLAASALTTLSFYGLFPPNQGHGWGYRDFHPVWMSLPLLATAALFAPPGMGSPQKMFEDSDTKTYVATCALLMLVFGVGCRAWQMQGFIAANLDQLPHYPGAERRVVFLDPRLMFYGGDLVQNDPWLRGNEIRMISHGVAEDRKLVARYYPTMHKVYADHDSMVFSAKPTDDDTQ